MRYHGKEVMITRILRARGRGAAQLPYRASSVVKRKAGVGSEKQPQPPVAAPPQYIYQHKPHCRKASVTKIKKKWCTVLELYDIITV